MLLLLLGACFEPARVVAHSEIDVKKGRLHLVETLYDVDLDKGCTDTVEACVEALRQELAGMQDADGKPAKTAGFRVHDGQVDVFVDLETKLDGWLGVYDGSHAFHVATAKEVAAGKPGHSGWMFSVPGSSTGTVKVVATGDARRLHLDGSAPEADNLWLVEKGRATVDVSFDNTEADGTPTHNGLAAKFPTLEAGLRAAGLLLP